MAFILHAFIIDHQKIFCKSERYFPFHTELAVAVNACLAGCIDPSKAPERAGKTLFCNFFIFLVWFLNRWEKLAEKSEA